MFHEDHSAVKCSPLKPLAVISSKEQNPFISRKCQIIKVPSVIQNLDFKKPYSVSRIYRNEEGRKQVMTDVQF